MGLSYNLCDNIDNGQERSLHSLGYKNMIKALKHILLTFINLVVLFSAMSKNAILRKFVLKELCERVHICMCNYRYKLEL